MRKSEINTNLMIERDRQTFYEEIIVSKKNNSYKELICNVIVKLAAA